MAAKLKLISARIPWSLLLKAFLFALAWWILPWHFFVLTAAVLYFIPFFQPGRLFLPFAGLLILCLNLPHSGIILWCLAAVFALILGVKDLIFVDRFTGYLTFLFIFLLLYSVYIFTVWNGPSLEASLWLLGGGVFNFLLFYGLLAYMPQINTRQGGMALALTSFIMVELGIIMLFMPIYASYGIVLYFTSQAMVLQVSLDYMRGHLNRRRMLIISSIFFVLFILLLAAPDISI